jgi:uncharacterized protein
MGATSFIRHLSASAKAIRSAFPDYNVTRYSLRSLLIPRAQSRWLSFLFETPVMKSIAEKHPRLFMKLQRPYLSRELSVNERLEALSSHYRFMNESLPAWSDQLHRQGKKLLLAEMEGRDGHRFRLELRPTARYDREGELALSLGWNEHQVATIVFSVTGTADKRRLSIGCIQGPPDADARTIVTEATKMLHRKRPKNFIVQALGDLAEVWGISELAGVSNAARVYQTSDVHADYDTFWGEFGAVAADKSFFLMPAPLPSKSVQEVDNRHRSEHRRRLAMRDASLEAMKQAAQALERPPVRPVKVSASATPALQFATSV